MKARKDFYFCIAAIVLPSVKIICNKILEQNQPNFVGKAKVTRIMIKEKMVKFKKYNNESSFPLSYYEMLFDNKSMRIA